MSAKKNYMLNSNSVKLRCSSSCASLFSRRPRHRPNRRRHLQNSSTTSSYTTTAATATPSSSSLNTPPLSYSSDPDPDVKSLRSVQGFGRLGGQSVAVEKVSDDPYLDFRRSMLQMILEKELYSKDELKELLNCFLQLNSPYYHGVIVRAFTEIWNGVGSDRPPPSPFSHGMWMSGNF